MKSTVSELKLRPKMQKFSFSVNGSVKHVPGFSNYVFWFIWKKDFFM